MTTQMYLMGGLVEGRHLPDRDLQQLREAKAGRRRAREERRGRRAPRR